MSDGVAPSEHIDDDVKNLHLRLYRGFLSCDTSQFWWEAITQNCLWHRVRYRSARFGKSCETPCFTAFFGGFADYRPYAPVPPWLAPLVSRVSEALGVPFNALLLRLYLDGRDEISWHTDGRTFLGPTPTIGSLSLGATCNFEMRRMRLLWPKVGAATAESAPRDDGVDQETAERSWALGDGDLLVMEGDTQAHWHHRVPPAKARRPRININFRYIVPGTDDAERGQAQYYKYMRDGDADGDGEERQRAGATYEALLRRSGSLLGRWAVPAAGEAFTRDACAASAAVSGTGVAVHAPPPPRTSKAISKAPALPATAAEPALPAADEGTTKAEPTEAMAEAEAETEAEWACPHCTLLNPMPSLLCRLCAYQPTCNSKCPPEAQVAREASPPKSMPGSAQAGRAPSVRRPRGRGLLAPRGDAAAKRLRQSAQRDEASHATNANAGSSSGGTGTRTLESLWGRNG